MDLIERIKEFSQDPDMIQECLALLKVGHEKGDSAEVIMSHVLLNMLFRFNKIPLKPGHS